MLECAATYHYNCLHILNVFDMTVGLIFVFYNKEI